MKEGKGRLAPGKVRSPFFSLSRYLKWEKSSCSINRVCVVPLPYFAPGFGLEAHGGFSGPLSRQRGQTAWRWEDG